MQKTKELDFGTLFEEWNEGDRTTRLEGQAGSDSKSQDCGQFEMITEIILEDTGTAHMAPKRPQRPG